MLTKKLLLVLMALIVSGCASTGTNKDDPWEGWNRGVYKFNKAVDDNVAKPLTLGYKAVTPDIVETGVSNVFSNLEDVSNAANNLLQGKIGDSFSDIGRLLVNTTLGIGGLWDHASDMGLEKHDEDFGQTLGVWGVESGPYVMLPFLGFSTLRDTAAFPVDRELDPVSHIDHDLTRYSVNVLQLIDTRSALLPLEEQLKDVIDEYAFTRDVYLQNRRFKVLDGEVPFEDDECDEEDEEDCDF
ncbi:VacJ family lipoprotein [Aliikangiella marina]|uniref:VacJ family lipoprotein n=1 Tax=Aliikangiella marina TaxID=1712262 RepID=A0A545T2J1_9GAMM|nr:VacJ family lipoprotein [Aliikangiella marina]TQV71434.1 VacJ family lipoprotein [Aliikangiella marina]